MREKITITVELTNQWEPNETNHQRGRIHLPFSFQDTTTTISDEEKKLGEVGGGVGAFWVRREVDEHGWNLGHDTFWKAFSKALEDREK